MRLHFYQSFDEKNIKENQILFHHENLRDIRLFRRQKTNESSQNIVVVVVIFNYYFGHFGLNTIGTHSHLQ